MALDMKGYQLTIYDTFTDLVGGATGVPSGQTWRVVMLEVCNTHDEPEPFFLRWLDSSESGAARTLADFEIIPGIPYYPLETELVMKTGDRLQAYSGEMGAVGVAGRIHVTITTDDGT